MADENEKPKMKRQRAANITVAERELLADLCLKFKDKIEDKRTDSTTVKAKEEAWQMLTSEFRASSTAGFDRDWLQLKHAYENMKGKAKKAAAAEKVDRVKTGGGTFVGVVNTIDEKVLALLGNRAVPLPNCFDSDAGYNGESDFDVRVTFASAFFEEKCLVSLGTGSLNEQMSTVSTVTCSEPGSITSYPESVPCVTSFVPSSSVLCPTSDTVAMASVQLTPLPATPSEPKTTDNACSAAKECTIARRKWANRRRVRPAARLQSSVEEHSSAAEKISSLVDIKDTYYREKLALMRQQHELFLEEHSKRMSVLDLKEQLAVKKLRKLEE